MKSSFYHIKRAALVLVLSSTALLSTGCGGSGGASNAGFSDLMLQATEVQVTASSAPSTTTSGNSSTTTMTLGMRPITLTEQDKKDFAANLTLGPATEQAAIMKGALKSDIWFTTPQAILIWWVSNDENPGVLQVTQFDGPRGPNTKVKSAEQFELSASANKFAKDWLAAHPQ